jgi:DNA-binding protein H-NS
MESYDLKIFDIEAALGKGRGRKAASPVSAKFKDPGTGAVWSGRGRAPLWLNGKNKDDSLIK